jgi:hypothetical protein
VAGAAALMLQAHPDWTGDDVRQAVRDGALADDAVGQVPNHDFGYGKLRVYRSLYGSDPPAGSPPDLVVEPVEVELGIASTLPYHVDDADLPNDALLVEVDRDYDGIYDEQVTGDEIEVVYDELGEHIVKLRVSDQTGRSDQALAFITVVPRKPDSVASALIPSGGLACAVGPIRRARSEPSWTLWLLAALAVSLRRRRARGTRRWCGPSPRRG